MVRGSVQDLGRGSAQEETVRKFWNGRVGVRLRIKPFENFRTVGSGFGSGLNRSKICERSGRGSVQGFSVSRFLRFSISGFEDTSILGFLDLGVSAFLGSWVYGFLCS